MKAAVDEVTSESGGVDALVNNAGYSQSGATDSFSPAAAPITRQSMRSKRFRMG